MKKGIIFLTAILLIWGCGGSDDNGAQKKAPAKKEKKAAAKEDKKEEAYDVMKDKGIGPIETVFMGIVSEELAATGKENFKIKCSACHKVEKRFVGPEMKGILDRRTPEWVMNMILNPEEMMEKNPTAKALYEEYLSPMANQNLTEEEARSILEYFRTI